MRESRSTWRRRGRCYLQRWPYQRAMVATGTRSELRLSGVWPAGFPLELVVANLNRILRGWGAYLRKGNSTRKFAAIDSYVVRRMALFASTKHGLRGLNWVARFDWSGLTGLGIYRLSGTAGRRAAHA